MQKGDTVAVPQETVPVKLPHRSRAEVRLLLVDDFERWRSYVRSFLERETQWTIFEACDGLEAVRKTVELHPDVVLLDIRMPGLNGIEAAEKIRQLSPDSRIIFLTLNGDKSVIAAALKTGAVGYVLKNEMVSGLIPAIRASLWTKQ